MNLNIFSVFPFPALATSRIFFSVGDSFSPPFAIISVYLEIPTNIHPIGSMYGTFTIQINHSCRWIYQSHGWYGHENIHPSLLDTHWMRGLWRSRSWVGWGGVSGRLTHHIWWRRGSHWSSWLDDGKMSIGRCFFSHFSCFLLIVAY